MPKNKKKKKLTKAEKVNMVARCVAEGGWSSIHSLAEELTLKQLNDNYSYLWDEEEEDEDE